MSEQKVTVYVVDDADLERESIRRWLREVGVETVPLRSGEEFVFHCRNDGPVVAVLDIQMTLSGDSTFRVMKIRGLGWVPTIFVSNTTDIDLATRLLAEGARAVMAKKVENKARLQEVVLDAMRSAEAIYSAGKIGFASSPLSRLTPGQIAIWAKFAKDGVKRPVDIARALGLSDSTVRAQLTRMFANLGVSALEEIAERYGNIDLQRLHELQHTFK